MVDQQQQLPESGSTLILSSQLVVSSQFPSITSHPPPPHSAAKLMRIHYFVEIN